ncbi:hypothetical protein COO60DRAFT_1550560 [Scenedesmus sp. NREL 46B-D3]|nr:hypothetical protein COO60DRAFT_1550560 [Scenedesmus sp. NREL 46B-D3]
MRHSQWHAAELACGRMLGCAALLCMHAVLFPIHARVWRHHHGCVVVLLLRTAASYCAPNHGDHCLTAHSLLITTQNDAWFGPGICKTMHGLVLVFADWWSPLHFQLSSALYKGLVCTVTRCPL